MGTLIMGTGFILDGVTRELVAVDADAPEVSLDTLKLAKWDQVKVQREACIDTGTTVPGIGPFDGNLNSRVNINGAVTMTQIALAAGEPLEIVWTLADNSVATLDSPTMVTVGVAVGEHVTACHSRAKDLRAEIEAAQDAAALGAIDIAEGWPVSSRWS
jgi:hypothetical protein